MSLDIWHIERYVCFWIMWFIKPTISSTVTMFSPVCWFHAFGQCCMFPKSLLITFPLFLPLQFIFKNFASILQKLYFLNWYKFLIRALSSLLNGTLHHQHIVSALKIIIYDNIICFCLQTSEVYVIPNIV